MSSESDNPEKGQLLEKSAQHRKLLEEEVHLITERSEKIITNALLIGGALALAYFLVSGLPGSGKKRKSKNRKTEALQNRPEADAIDEADDEPRQAGIVSQIGAVLVAQATGLLLTLAKEKLTDFLQSKSLTSENTNEHS